MISKRFNTNLAWYFPIKLISQFEGRYTNLGDWAIFEEMIDMFHDDIINKKVEIIVPSILDYFAAPNDDNITFDNPF